MDIEALPGVDFVVDVREPLPFADATYIYAEHFVEHLSQSEGLRFLRECRKALRPNGTLRLSTPNLEWVLHALRTPEDPIRECFELNKAFRAWGHQFLYNETTLTAALHDAGFASVQLCAYGESTDATLRGLEHHERSADTPSLPHVVILEARGLAPCARQLDALADDYDWATRS